MALKIERVAVNRRRKVNPGEWRDFLRAVKKLKAGQSFKISRISSNHRIILSATEVFLGANFSALKEDGGYRVVRNT